MTASTGPSKASAHRPGKPGRPRSEEADRAILDAALEELVARGLAGVSMESIAARAGVAKTTLYRRWKDKVALCLEAVGRTKAPLAEPATGSLRGDLLQVAEEQYRELWEGEFGRLMPRFAVEARQYPELARQFWAEHIATRREVGYRVLRAAQARGEIRADVDLELVWEMLHGPANLRALWRITPMTRPEIEQAVDLVLAALKPSD
jgi:AcrR family transcriptional regulator